jgi:hypothetical protein
LLLVHYQVGACSELSCSMIQMTTLLLLLLLYCQGRSG